MRSYFLLAVVWVAVLLMAASLGWDVARDRRMVRELSGFAPAPAAVNAGAPGSVPPAGGPAGFAPTTFRGPSGPPKIIGPSSDPPNY